MYPVSPTNLPCKYADDTYLLVSAANTSSIPQEIQHTSDWVTANNLELNSTESQEMIVHLPRTCMRKYFSYPSPTTVADIELVNILGITVSSTLTFHHHISTLVTKSVRSLYPLKTIRSQGLNGNAL